MIRTIFEKCIDGKKKHNLTITGNSIYSYNVSPYILYCELFASVEEKDQITSFQSLIMSKGREHELNVYKKLFDDIQPMKFENEEDGFLSTLEEFKKGTKLISNCPLFYLKEDLMGRPDLVERRSGKSIFGDFHYVIKEIKSSKNIKKEQIMQTCFYNYLLGKIQNYTPEKFYLINREMKEHSFEYSEYEPQLKEQLKNVKEIINGKKVTPEYNCNWPWTSYSKKEALKSKDISLICGVGNSIKEKLNQIGIQNLNDFTKKDFSKLKIKGLTIDRIKKFKLSAESLLTNKFIILKNPQLDKFETEIFFDFEGAPDVGEEEVIGIDYLIGCLVRKNKKEEFIPFVAKSIEDEERMFKEFVKFIEKQKNFVLYHYATYEKTHVKKLGEKYKINVDFILKNMVDLLTILKNSVVCPTYSNSIKDIAPLLGFKWRQTDVKGDESISLYLDYLKDKDVNKLNKIIKYNEDDVIATRVVKDWLENGCLKILN